VEGGGGLQNCKGKENAKVGKTHLRGGIGLLSKSVSMNFYHGKGGRKVDPGEKWVGLGKKKKK